MRSIIALLLVLLVVATLSVGPAFAGPKGKGGNGGKGGKAPPAVMVVEPNPAIAWGGEYTVTGSGFYANRWVSLSVAGPGCCSAFNQWAGGSGSISFARLTGDPGTYKIDAYQLKGRKYVLMATVTFEVEKP